LDKTESNTNKDFNLKNLKTDFRKSCKKYFPDKNNNLYYKKIIRKKNKDNKYISKEEIFYVPTINELIK